MTPRATLCAALALALVVSTTAFSLSPSAPLQLRKQAMCSASSQFVGAHRLALAPSVRAARPPSVAVSMSIFGLGAPELVVSSPLPACPAVSA
ncbi:hypothetical protein T484DRAFT_1861004 [Baffinella frigidus]|nr:hypothetical protein T484DRAFT_1861004 [Cryptophyta sp. CCMP2293]